jgi:hypothetical protein
MHDRPPALGDIRRYDVSSTAKLAWWEEFRAWVRQFRIDYAEHWPDEGKVTQVQMMWGQRIKAYKPGWPPCWAQHRDLVELLVVVRERESGLLRGAEWAGGVDGGENLARFVQECVAEYVRLIKQRCEDGHVDKSRLYNEDFDQSDKQHEAQLRAELGMPVEEDAELSDGFVPSAVLSPSVQLRPDQSVPVGSDIDPDLSSSVRVPECAPAKELERHRPQHDPEHVSSLPGRSERSSLHRTVVACALRSTVHSGHSENVVPLLMTQPMDR